jgi:hypothetical protein
VSNRIRFINYMKWRGGSLVWKHADGRSVDLYLNWKRFEFGGWINNDNSGFGFTFGPLCLRVNTNRKLYVIDAHSTESDPSPNALVRRGEFSFPEVPQGMVREICQGNLSSADLSFKWMTSDIPLSEIPIEDQVSGRRELI